MLHVTGVVDYGSPGWSLYGNTVVVVGIFSSDTSGLLRGWGGEPGGDRFGGVDGAGEGGD